ncbi:MAG: FAD-dependent oxidoreductase [Patescibacteria group bacterium]|jgi:thioredoxin reductase (NADPH)
MYDLIIIGAGPAGLTASIYASRYKINHLVIGEIPGGLISEAHNVCNFPTYKEISGFELMEKMKSHVEDLGGQIMSMEKVAKIEKNNDVFELTLESQKVLSAKNILLATGTKHRQLGLEEEKKFLGKGVAYCATCDAMFFKDKIVGVMGGGNSATTASLYLSEIAQKVYLIARGDKLKGEMVWVDNIMANKKIEVLLNTNIIKLNGENKLESITLDQEVSGSSDLKLDGLFIEIGTEPDTFLTEMLGVETDRGYIVVDKEQKTNVAGVWSAGDITTNSAFFRQVITACSEGAVASYSIFSSLQKNK